MNGCYENMSLKELKKYKPNLSEIVKLFDECFDLPDRAHVLVAHALLESMLEKALKARCAFQDETIFARPGLLSGFSSRLEFAKCIGFLTKPRCSDISHINEIRNIFAHNPLNLSFSFESIASKCRSLKIFDLATDQLQGDHYSAGKSYRIPSVSGFDRVSVDSSGEFIYALKTVKESTPKARFHNSVQLNTYFLYKVSISSKNSR